MLFRRAGPTGPIAGLAPAAEATTTVTVANVAVTPTVRAIPAAAGQLAFEALVADPGTRDTFTYEWVVTGGTVVGANNTRTVAITPGAGAISVLLRVRDDDMAAPVEFRTEVVRGGTGGDTISVNTSSAIVNGVTTNYASGTGKVIVYGQGGNDAITAAAATIPVELLGGAGADTLTGGNQADVLLGNTPGDYALPDPYTGDTSADSLTGGDGNDTIDGGLGNDTMAGGAGNEGTSRSRQQRPADRARQRRDRHHRLRCSFSGIDFSLAETNGPQTVSTTATGTHTVEIKGQFENLVGSAFSDSLDGNQLDNQISGGAGNDVIFGGDPVAPPLPGTTEAPPNGNDSLGGGQGNDTVIGGGGNDVIFGGDLLDPTRPANAPPPPPDDPGDDSLVGGTGNDTIKGGKGNDTIFGGDPLTPPPGSGAPTPMEDDSLEGGAGNVVRRDRQPRHLRRRQLDPAGGWRTAAAGRSWDDSLVGGTGNDTVKGQGNDAIFGATRSPRRQPRRLRSPTTTAGGCRGNDIITAHRQ